MIEKGTFSVSTYQLVSGWMSDLSVQSGATFTPIMLSPVSEQEIPVPVPAEPSLFNDSIQSVENNIEPHFYTSSHYTHTMHSNRFRKEPCKTKKITHYHNHTQHILDLFYAFVISCVALYLYLCRHQRKSRINIVDETTYTERETVPNQKRFANNIQIILDYDDTIFPTHYTFNRMEKEAYDDYYMDRTEWDQLKDLNTIVYKSLLMWIELFGASNICIVSNAKLSWIDDTFFMYNGLYLNIRDLIISNQIKVISATDSYRSEKVSAFMSVLKKKKNINKVICIGDSQQEYDDIDIVCSVLRLKRRRKRNGSMNYCRFKLSDQPSLSKMISQLQKIKGLDYTMISQHHCDESYLI